MQLGNYYQQTAGISWSQENSLEHHINGHKIDCSVQIRCMVTLSASSVLFSMDITLLTVTWVNFTMMYVGLHQVN